MFENLDKINWKSLHAEKVPELLRGLLSADENTLDNLLNELFNLIYREQTLHISSLDVIPFLIDILPRVASEVKGDLLMLLSELASDVLYSSVRNPRYEFSRQCHEAVRKGLNVYLEIAQNQEGLRHSVISLLYHLPEDAKRTIPVLILLRQSEPDNYLKARITLAISHLLTENPIFSDLEKSEYLRLLESWFEAEISSQAKFATGVGIINLAGESASKEIVDYIVTSFNQENMTVFHDDPHLTLTQSLLKLDFERSIASISRLLKTTDSVSRITRIIHWLLDLTFKIDPLVKEKLDETSVLHHAETQKINLPHILAPELQTRLRSIKRLTPHQKQVVEIILNTNQFWESQGNLLEFYGLPTRREELLKLFSFS